jgi:hypothetical protein
VDGWVRMEKLLYVKVMSEKDLEESKFVMLMTIIAMIGINTKTSNQP